MLKECANGITGSSVGFRDDDVLQAVSGDIDCMITWLPAAPIIITGCLTTQSSEKIGENLKAEEVRKLGSDREVTSAEALKLRSKMLKNKADMNLNK